MTIPDGGQAFPILECSMNSATGEMHSFQGSYGLSIRDYFAAHCATFDDKAPPDWVAKSLNIETLPAGSTHYEWFLWWRRAEALWRYAQADAMLNVR